MLQYNRGFLRLMRDEIIPRAGEAQDVVKVVMKIMAADKPKAHYVIGKDARFATTLQWLGLTGVLENKIHNKLLAATRRENRRTEARKAKRKKPPANQ